MKKIKSFLLLPINHNLTSLALIEVEILVGHAFSAWHTRLQQRAGTHVHKNAPSSAPKKTFDVSLPVS